MPEQPSKEAAARPLQAAPAKAGDPDGATKLMLTSRAAWMDLRVQVMDSLVPGTDLLVAPMAASPEALIWVGPKALTEADLRRALAFPRMSPSIQSAISSWWTAGRH